VPPVQKAVSAYTERTIDRKLRASVPGPLGDAIAQARMRGADGKVVQGEVIRDDRPGGPYDAGDGRPPLTG
jgi:UPF0716 protein FxsA